MKKYLLHLLISADVFINNVLGGHYDETISSRWARAETEGRWYGRWGCAFLNWLQPGHCHEAMVHDWERAEATQKVIEPKIDEH